MHVGTQKHVIALNMNVNMNLLMNLSHLSLWKWQTNALILSVNASQAAPPPPPAQCGLNNIHAESWSNVPKPQKEPQGVHILPSRFGTPNGVLRTLSNVSTRAVSRPHSARGVGGGRGSGHLCSLFLPASYRVQRFMSMKPPHIRIFCCETHIPTCSSRCSIFP